MPATWLADVLRAAGVPVIEEAGWKDRSQAGSFTPRGLIRHWDASTPGSHGAVEYMRDNIACNITTCRGNSSHGPSVHVLAAGRAWHAGEGSFPPAFPTDQGNTYAVGHEVAHTVDEPWSDAQLDVVVAAEQAVLRHLGADVDTGWCTHSEYAPTRKIDTTGGRYGQSPATERQRLSGAPPPPTRKELDVLMMMTGDGRVWTTDGLRKKHIGPGLRDALLAAGVPNVGYWSSQTVDELPTDPGEFNPYALAPPSSTGTQLLAGAGALLALVALVLVVLVATGVLGPG